LLQKQLFNIVHSKSHCLLLDIHKTQIYSACRKENFLKLNIHNSGTSLEVEAQQLLRNFRAPN